MNAGKLDNDECQLQNMKTEYKMTAEYSMWNTDYSHNNQCLKRAEYEIYDVKNRMTKMTLTVF